MPETLADLQTRNTLNRDRAEMLTAFGDAMRAVEQSANKPTGGRRNRYIAALLLAEQKGVGFLELDTRVFTASETSAQTSFAAASKRYGKPNYIVVEHSTTGRQYIFCPTHPKGNESATRWHLMVDNGWTVSEINQLATEYNALHTEADENNATESWVTTVIDSLYDDITNPDRADSLDDNEDDAEA
jgi:hypothetical protein